MQKLKLHLDDLSVESFNTIPMEKAKGTVIGKEATEVYTCDDATCVGTCQTCSPTCWDTCRVRICYGTGTSA